MSVTVLRRYSLLLPGEGRVNGWRWRHRRGFTVRLGTTLVLVAW